MSTYFFIISLRILILGFSKIYLVIVNWSKNLCQLLLKRLYFISHLIILSQNLQRYVINKIRNARRNGVIFNQINKLKIKTYSYISHIKIHYYPKYEHLQYIVASSENYLKIQNMFRLIVMIEEIHLIFHVVNGWLFKSFSHHFRKLYH